MVGNKHNVQLIMLDSREMALLWDQANNDRTSLNRP